MSDEADLQRQLAVLNERIKDAKSHAAVREEKLKTECAELEKQNVFLKKHIKTLDAYIKTLSLIHSQMTALPKYNFAKPEIEEVLKLVANI